MEVPVRPFEHHSSQGSLLLHSSPLDTLVRRTSSRQLQKRKSTSRASADVILPSPRPRHAPPRPLTSQPVPEFPLLHSNFRNSTASAVNTRWQNPESFQLCMNNCEASDDCHEDNNSSSSHNHYNHYPTFAAPSTSTHSELHNNLWPEAIGHSQPTTLDYLEDSMQPPPSPLPTVIVSSPLEDGPRPKGPMRQPIVSQNGFPRLNFSRPGRPPIVSSEDQKRQVLERNSKRANSPRTSPSPVSFGPVTPVTGMYPDRGPAPSASLSPAASYLRPSSPLLALSSHPPPLRATSPASLYSNSYSFYQIDSAVQSPRTSPNSSPDASRPPSDEPQTPEDFLQLGIQYHEANQLKDSAVYFEKSAKEQGGCCVGMLMWGLTLRHGWGCEKNEKSGFKWLTKAAESAVEDLEKARKGFDVRGVKVRWHFFVCYQSFHVHDRRSSCLRFTR